MPQARVEALRGQWREAVERSKAWVATDSR